MPYLGSLVHCSDGSELEIERHTAFIRESMFALDWNIWGSGITLETKLLLYNTCLLPIFLYGTEIWCLTSTLEKKIDAVDNWCLRRVLHIHWTDFVSNDVVWLWSRTGQLLLSDTIRQWRSIVLLWSCVPCRHRSRPLPSSLGLHSGSSQRLGTKNWKTEANWLRMIEDDLHTLNFKTAHYG